MVDLQSMKSVEEFRQQSLQIIEEKVPKQWESFLDIKHGVETGTSVKFMREYIDSIMFKMKLLRDVKNPAMEMTFLGYKLTMPIMPAPLGGGGWLAVWPNAIDSVVEAGDKAGTMNWVGYPMTDEKMKSLAHLTKAPLAWIVKPIEQKLLCEKLEQGDEMGLAAVGVDIDCGPGIKCLDFTFPYRTTPKTVDELRKAREMTDLPFILKGIMSVEDAQKAVEIGANAIVVSIHGGSSGPDYVTPPMMALPEIADAVGRQIEVLVDGQIRRGTDILKALALGAKAVLIGRPIIWGCALGGSKGIEGIYKILTQELLRTMIATGIKSVEDVPRDILVCPSITCVPQKLFQTQKNKKSLLRMR